MRTKRKPAFPGGVHPTDGFDKALSMDAVTKSYWPDTVTILSEQSLAGSANFWSSREIPLQKDSLSENQKHLWLPPFMPA